MVKTRSMVIDLSVVKDEDEEVSLEIQPRRVKKEEDEKPFLLSASSIERRLAQLEQKPITIDLDPKIVTKCVSRVNFLSRRYGGNQQDTFSKVAAEKTARHGIALFGFPMPYMNPYLPTEPGQPGLTFTRAPAISVPLFRWWESDTWQYFGEYIVKASEALSVEEWLSQTPSVRDSWVDGYMNKEWGREARVDMVLREELQRRPDYEEFARAKAQRRWTEVDREAMEAALNNGTEKIPVSAIECIAYREEFQQELVQVSALPKSKWKTSPFRKRTLAKEDSETNSDDLDRFADQPNKRPRTNSQKAGKRRKVAKAGGVGENASREGGKAPKRGRDNGPPSTPERQIVPGNRLWWERSPSPEL